MKCDKLERIIIALGGNSIDTGNSTNNDQIRYIENTFKKLEKIISENEVVLTYGNGPQVGNIYDRMKEEYSINLCDSMSQGLLSYIIANGYDKIKYEYGLSRDIIPVFTRTVIDENNYSLKPIGKYYNEKLNDNMVKLINKGYRFAVKSPEPLDILEKSAISSLLADGYVPLAIGGGGVPVVRELGYYKNFYGIVDKDLASSLLGTLIDADRLIIITGVNNVYINYGKNNQKPLKKINYNQLLNYYNENQFEEGTMKPKIRAALNFIRKGGKRVNITSIENVDRLDDGTTVY